MCSNPATDCRHQFTPAHLHDGIDGDVLGAEPLGRSHKLRFVVVVLLALPEPVRVPRVGRCRPGDTCAPVRTTGNVPVRARQCPNVSLRQAHVLAHLLRLYANM